MKTLFLLALVTLVGVTNLAAQTTARDWTKTDCDGNEHNLFAELDNGNVIVLEFVMMNCSPCVTAAKGLKPTVAQFADSHPDKVKMYSIGFSDSYTCQQMMDWRTKAGLSHAVFTEGESDVDYYGGMGMPTIVVVGGSSHKVYYKKLGYQPGENTKIAQAITQALQETTTGVSETEEPANLNLYPHPVQSDLTVSFQAGTVDELVVTDITGREVIRQNVPEGSAHVVLSMSHVENGTYSLRLLHLGTAVDARLVIVGR
jgi:hypothetical protein